MAMYIEYQYTDDKGRALSGQATWHVGEPYPVSVMVPVSRIFVDGNEKSYITKRFKNIPTTTGRHITYVGEIARFIHVNLSMRDN